jgi:ABC-type uncharacterized transport system permease subunit
LLLVETKARSLLEQRSHNMQTQRLYAAVMAALLAMIIWVAAAETSPSAALLAELRLFGLVVIPTLAVTTLLTAFFEWRRALRQRFLQEADEYPGAA